MRQILWQLIAKALQCPGVADWLILRAMRTPYTHLSSADGRDVYMYRYWLFNPYPVNPEQRTTWRSLLPSVRIHKIMRADKDRHLHDHPWNARTIILRGGYMEEREAGENFYRFPGDTARLLFGEYHRIAWVCNSGVWALFITWKYRGTWGFLVDGVKVPWRQYLSQREG